MWCRDRQIIKGGIKGMDAFLCICGASIVHDIMWRRHSGVHTQWTKEKSVWLHDMPTRSRCEVEKRAAVCTAFYACSSCILSTRTDTKSKFHNMWRRKKSVRMHSFLYVFVMHFIYEEWHLFQSTTKNCSMASNGPSKIMNSYNIPPLHQKTKESHGPRSKTIKRSDQVEFGKMKPNVVVDNSSINCGSAYAPFKPIQLERHFLKSHHHIHIDIDVFAGRDGLEKCFLWCQRSNAISFMTSLTHEALTVSFCHVKWEKCRFWTTSRH